MSAGRHRMSQLSELFRSRKSVFLSNLVLICCLFVAPQVLSHSEGIQGNNQNNNPPPTPAPNNCGGGNGGAGGGGAGGGNGASSSTANPVRLFTGGKEMFAADMVVNGIYPIEIHRNYDSVSSYDSPLGYGWALNHDRALYEYSDNSVVIRYGCGKREKFVLSGGNYVSTTHGLQGDLQEQGDGSFIFTYEDGTADYFDSLGRLTAAKDVHGNQLDYTYSSERYPLIGTSPFGLDPTKPITVAYHYRLTRIEERLADGVLTGNAVELAYHAETGRLTSITASDGRQIEYAHDVIDNNGAISTAGNLVGVTGLENVVTRYRYEDPNNNHNLTYYQVGADTVPHVIEFNANGRVVTQTYGNLTQTFTYVSPEPEKALLDTLSETVLTEVITDDEGNNPVSYTTHYRFNASGYLTELVDAEGNLTFYQLRHTDNRLLAVSYFDSAPDANSARPLIKREQFTYYPDARTESQVIFRTDGTKVTTTWTYAGAFIESQTVVDNRRPSEVFRTVYTFYENANGQPTHIRQVSADRGDGTFETVEYFYNAKHQITEVLLPTGVKYRVDYQNESLYPTHTYWQQPNQTPELDQAIAYYANGLVHSVTDADNRTATVTYDALHRPVSVTLNNGESHHYTYTGYLLTAVEVGRVGQSSGQITRLTYDNQDRLTAMIAVETDGTEQIQRQYRYDGLGRRIADVDQDSQITSYTYDGLNRIVAVTDALNQTTAMRYDAIGRLIQVTDARNLSTHYTYDELNNVVKLNSPDTGVTEYTYDAVGNLLSQVNAKEIWTHYSYDRLGRLTQINYPAAPQENKGFYYDHKGNITQQKNTQGSHVERIRYSYTPSGQLDNLLYPSGLTVHHSYDSIGRLLGLTATNPGETQLYTVVNNAAYEPFGALATLTFGNGLNLTQNFDSRYRLSQRTLSQPSPTPQTLNQLSYGYDNRFNITSILDDLNPSKNSNYHYDAVDRLTQDIRMHGDIEFDYDAVSNRTQRTANGTSVDYDYSDTSNRLTELATSAISYDAIGNITQRSQGTDAVAYDYNAEGRYTALRINGQQRASYRYNPFGERIQKTLYEGGSEIGSETYSYGMEGQLLATRQSNASGTLQAVVHYVYFGGAPIAQVTTAYSGGQAGTSEVVYLHTDHLATPRLATDSQGDIVWEWNSTAFGVGLPNEDVDGDGQVTRINLRFPGQYFDQETGLHYNYFRDYDPGLGRYIQSDPIGLDDGPNTYGYVHGNPVNYFDPNGLTSLAACANPLNAAACAAAGIVPAAINGATTGALVSAGINGWQQALSGCGFNAGSMARAAGMGALTGAAFGGAFSWAGKFTGAGYSGLQPGLASSIFSSSSAGVSSSLFGHTVLRGSNGMLNQAGSVIKIGWSTASKNGTYGMQIRIGIGNNAANTNIATSHIYVPGTFVPNAQSNVYIATQLRIISGK